MTSTLHLLTAPRGAGKTTFCRALADRARTAGWDVAGLLSPAVFEDGAKTGILAQDLRTSETRLLAVANQQFNPVQGKSSSFPTLDLPLGDWLFDSSVIAWGNQILETCLPCDLLIVDEIGPLELNRGAGWVNALETLRQPGYRVGVVVIRSECIDDFSKLGISFRVKGLSGSQAILGELH
ncbi:MAG: nucleoside-triphosphatase [Chloroflexota bacterium]